MIKILPQGVGTFSTIEYLILITLFFDHFRPPHLRNFQFYNVFLKVRLTKWRKGCTQFPEVAILRSVFEGWTHQVP